MYDWPWSSNQLRRLTKHVREDAPLRPGDPTYAEVMLWYNDIALEVSSRIENLDWRPLLGDTLPKPVTRVKTRDTLRDKLNRFPGLQLKSIQDIAGVRLEADMSLASQDAVAQAICDMFEQPRDAIKDLRTNPHSGYRGVHVWLRLPANVEVQVRTSLQGAWANMYESAADVFGREIRYEVLPEDPDALKVVKDLQTTSLRDIAILEELRTDLERMELEPESLPALAAQKARSIEQRRSFYEVQQATLHEHMRAIQAVFDEYRANQERE